MKILSILSYQECLDELNSFEGRGVNRELTRVENALEKLGNPHHHFKSIHIAGTNGKGSTVAFIAQILKLSGYITGFTISPHLSCVRERIRLNNQWMNEEDFVFFHNHMRKILSDIPLTYFEWIIVMAFFYFYQKKIDWAVVETGLGGRWDATNVLRPMAGVITQIGLEHQDYLGNSLEEILTEKMQILKPNQFAWTAITQEGLLEMLWQYCFERSIPFYVIDDYLEEEKKDRFSFFGLENLKCSLKGRHQIRNACLAIGVCLTLRDDGFIIPDEAITQGIASTKWPGRFEQLLGQPRLIVDAAHNLDGIRSLVDEAKKTSDTFDIYFSALKDRPFLKMALELADMAERLTLVPLSNGRAPSLLELQNYQAELSRLLKIEVRILEGGVSKLKEEVLSAASTTPILVTGSIYFIGEVRPYFVKEE